MSGLLDPMRLPPRGSHEAIRRRVVEAPREQERSAAAEEEQDAEQHAGVGESDPKSQRSEHR
jgi:hypothetical protein